VSDLQRDDDRRIGPLRWVVRFRGMLTPNARAKLGADGFRFNVPSGLWTASSTFEDHTAVGLLAVSEKDAIRLVQEALVGLGDFTDFEAVKLSHDA
jgi:hypothetical protein